MNTYVYGIVRAAHPLDGDLPGGVGDPPAKVRLLSEGALAAVVSEAPEGLRAKRRDLLAHQSVVAALTAAGPVLPMRFGSVSPDDDAVRTVLAERRDHFAERLSALEGRVEFNVKAAHREEEVLRGILARDPEVRELNERTRGSGSQEERLRLGELVAAAVQRQEVADAELVRRSLAPVAEAENPGPERSDFLCNYSFLVDSAAAGDFQAAAARLAKEHPHLELTVHGPLPPYSFVEPGTRAAA